MRLRSRGRSRASFLLLFRSRTNIEKRPNSDFLPTTPISGCIKTALFAWTTVRARCVCMWTLRCVHSCGLAVGVRYLLSIQHQRQHSYTALSERIISPNQPAPLYSIASPTRRRNCSSIPSLLTDNFYRSHRIFLFFLAAFFRLWKLQ